MIGRTEAERNVGAVRAVRPDWPEAQLVTLLRELHSWPFLDLLVGLVYVAGEQRLDGTWVSASPYRVKEQGPWRTVGIADADAGQRRQREARDRDARRAEREARLAAVHRCGLCDDRGYLPGRLCGHDPADEERGHRGAERAREELARIKAARAGARTADESEGS